MKKKPVFLSPSFNPRYPDFSAAKSLCLWLLANSHSWTAPFSSLSPPLCCAFSHRFAFSLLDQWPIAPRRPSLLSGRDPSVPSHLDFVFLKIRYWSVSDLVLLLSQPLACLCFVCFLIFFFLELSTTLAYGCIYLMGFNI